MVDKYPLEQVLEIKKDRVDKAEQVVKEKQRTLEIEQEKLRQVEMERDAAKEHHDDKLAQLRKVLDEGTTSPEVQQMKAYLKVVKEKLAKEEGKVKEQKKQVKKAEEELESAKLNLKQKRIEVQKIEMHKEEWTKEANKERLREETRIHDELGQTIHQANKRKKRG